MVDLRVASAFFFNYLTKEKLKGMLVHSPLLAFMEAMVSKISEVIHVPISGMMNRKPIQKKDPTNVSRPSIT
jgi:hypothetical protein